MPIASIQATAIVVRRKGYVSLIVRTDPAADVALIARLEKSAMEAEIPLVAGTYTLRATADSPRIPGQGPCHESLLALREAWRISLRKSILWQLRAHGVESMDDGAFVRQAAAMFLRSTRFSPFMLAGDGRLAIEAIANAPEEFLSGNPFANMIAETFRQRTYERAGEIIGLAALWFVRFASRRHGHAGTMSSYCIDIGKTTCDQPSWEAEY